MSYYPKDVPMEKDASLFLKHVGGSPDRRDNSREASFTKDNLIRDNRDNDYERRLKAEVTRLQDALDAEKRRWEAERRSMADRVREEVERRLRSQEEESRRHIAALNDEIRRLNDEARSKIETLVSENVKLQREIDDLTTNKTTTAPATGTMDISDLFPMGLAGVQLGSLSRPEWRQLFQQLVAELVRRKRTKVVEMPKRRTSSYHHDDITSRVNSLWSTRPAYTPPPMPAPRRDADDFLRWGGGGRKGTADDFLDWGADRGRVGGRNEADDFLAFGGTKRVDDDLLYRRSEPTTLGGGMNAEAFLKFGGGR